MDAELDQRLDALMVAITEVGERAEAGFAAVERRFGEVNLRFERIDRRLDGIDARLDGMDRRLDGMDGALSALRAEMRERFDVVDSRLLLLEAARPRPRRA